MDKKSNEELTFDRSALVSEKGSPILGRLSGPVADIINPTRNGRKYSEQLWENVFNSPIAKETFENGGYFGELGHPADRQEIDMEKIAICMPNPPRKNNKGQLISSFDILDTPNGRILKTLCDYGYKMGISSRGSGDVSTDIDGNESVDEDTYEFSCFDVVLLPAVKAARMEYVTESVGNSSIPLKKALQESLEKASASDRKIMQETLNTLHIEYTPEEEIIEKPSSVNYKEVVNEDVAVDTTEADLLEQLQASLKENKEKEQQLLELQEKLSVSYTKEASCNEKMAKYKQAILKLSEEAKKVVSLQEKLSNYEQQVSQLNEQLASVKDEAIKSKNSLTERSRALAESVTSSRSKVAELTEQLKIANENSSKEITSLTEKLSTAQKDLAQKKTEYAKKLSASNNLVEKYKKIAAGAVNRYIESQSVRLGVSKNEILNRLPDSYTFDDIDSVCESLQSVNLNLSKLPFQSMQLQEKLSAKITSPKKEIIPIVQDDVVDDDLLSLARLK